MKLKDRVSLITGGARGIGREIAYLFAKEGCFVVIADINLEEAIKTKQDFQKENLFLEVLELDVSEYLEVEEAVNKILDKFKRIDILVNNAGITRDNLILRMSQEEWDKVIDINLKGTFNCIKAVSRVMIKQRYGKIINIASVVGLIGNSGQANYSASKAGIIALTKTVAKELASRNINVNAVAPGFIDTEMTAKLPQDIKEKMLSQIPLARFGQPQDIARVCLFLASEDSSYITGQTLVVDGGMVMY
ncbi:MAG: 3-oxoacyl-[acyl-carrier-protein] reductase [Candidatus Omnitrophica bacterium]|nr:3-oxoacyl-[acyl-carrier-protein] reductase [Candidatus Omnitrophota bacterium]